MSVPARGPARVGLVMLVLAACVALAALLSLAFGSRPIPFHEVLGALFTDVDSDNATVIRSQRLPRTALGLVVGAGLGLAGALMQGHTRNPLADPGLFGVNAGAAFAVALVVFAGGAQSPAVVVAALLGAAAASALVFVLGLRGVTSSGLVLLAVVGTALSALLAALTSALVLTDRQTLDTLRFWQVGALSNRETSMLTVALPIIVVGAVLALVNSFSLTALSLGDEVASSLGTRVLRSRLVGIGAITLLAGTATALCGPIAFLGLVAPHAARVVARHDYRLLVPMSALIGAVVIELADTAGRVVARPGELQVGIVLAVVGAPVLLAVARRRRVVAL